VPDRGTLVECVVNVSEGRRTAFIDEAVAAGADELLDVHSDGEHNRTVLTLGGTIEAVEAAARRVVTVAVARIDLRHHRGVHPRFGAADVVPFVDLSPRSGGAPAGPEVGARDRLARWAGAELDLPCFLYGPERSLPELRRAAFRPLPPDTGPSLPHPTAGACAVGARPVLVAYNVWITEGGGPRRAEVGTPLATARAIAAELRRDGVRTLGLAVHGGAQVSVNLTDPTALALVELYDTVAARAEALGCSVVRGELVGLVPEAVLRRAPRHRWPELDLGEDRTIEDRMAAKGHGVAAGRPGRTEP
jgi:glutamate formiminotransferase / 5-formyltetrahydrofolate cyclo-ligase